MLTVVPAGPDPGLTVILAVSAPAGAPTTADARSNEHAPRRATTLRDLIDFLPWPRRWTPQPPSSPTGLEEKAPHADHFFAP
jgi:hypothetical protein